MWLRITSRSIGYREKPTMISTYNIWLVLLSIGMAFFA